MKFIALRDIQIEGKKVKNGESFELFKEANINYCLKKGLAKLSENKPEIETRENEPEKQPALVQKKGKKKSK